MKLMSKLTSRVRILALLPMLGLGLVLTGCEELAEVGDGMSSGKTHTYGTVETVNSAERTMEIKTDQGSAMVIAVTDTTKLRKYTGSYFSLSGLKDSTFDEIKVGKYLELACLKEPVNGKYDATWIDIFDSKSAYDAQ